MSSLKQMNFEETLMTEVVKDAAKYKLWMRRFETWISSQAGSSSLEVDPFFKKIREAKPQVTTKELFEELKGNAEQAAQWIRLSGEIQSFLVLLCEGEPLQIVEQTRSSVAEGQGFESLRRLLNNYDAQH